MINKQFLYHFFTSLLFIQFAIIFSSTLLVVLIGRYFLKKLQTSSAVPAWVHEAAYFLHKHCSWIVISYSTLSVAQLMTNQFFFGLSIDQARSLFFTSVLMLFVFEAKYLFTRYFIQRRQNNKIIFDVLERASTIFIIFNIILMVLNIIGIPLQGLLAFGGMGGIAIGWAAKDIVSNFFGGLMIFVNRPFVVGNWIMSPNKHFEGTVEKIGWYMTQIRTFDRRPMYIPNSLIIDAIIQNPGRMYNRRIKETMCVRFSDASKMNGVVTHMKAMLEKHPDIDQEQTLMVDVVGFGEYGLKINIYTFTKTTDWAEYRSVQQDVLLKLVNIIYDAGAAIAYPTRSLSLQDEKSSFVPAPIQNKQVSQLL